jgi:Uma2 family endonuclease
MASVIEPAAEPELPDRYEVVNGEVVGREPMSWYAAEVANRIRDELTVYARATGRGRTRSDMLFRLPLAEDRNRQREPDVVFVTFDWWPLDRPLPLTGDPTDVVPELMVEVVSPTDKADDLFAKAQEYLAAGGRVVWIVIPRARQAFILEPDADPRAVRERGELDGGAAFPDLRIPMAGLFPAVAADE